MAVAPSERDAILHAIARWPIEDQLVLARTILERAASGQPRSSREEPARSTWDALYGIASNGQEPPSDQQVARWFEERQCRK